MSLAEREQVQGPDHPDALDPDDPARIYGEANMPIRRSTCTRGCWPTGVGARTRAPDTFGVRSQLAGTHLAVQARSAIALYQRNLADWEQAHGPFHLTYWPNTCISAVPTRSLIGSTMP